MTEIVLSPLMSTLLARKELERNKLVEFANATFGELIAIACKDAGVPEGAEFNLTPMENGQIKITFSMPEATPVADSEPAAETVPTDSEGAE